MIPVCLVCEQVGDDAEQDYNQFGSGEISLQVAMLYSPLFPVILRLCQDGQVVAMDVKQYCALHES